MVQHQKQEVPQPGQTCHGLNHVFIPAPDILIELRRKDKGGALSNHQAWGHLDGDIHANWRVDIDDNPGLDTNARLNFAILQTATSSDILNLCD